MSVCSLQRASDNVLHGKNTGLQLHTQTIKQFRLHDKYDNYDKKNRLKCNLVPRACPFDLRTGMPVRPANGHPRGTRLIKVFKIFLEETGILEETSKVGTLRLQLMLIINNSKHFPEQYRFLLKRS